MLTFFMDIVATILIFPMFLLVSHQSSLSLDLLPLSPLLPHDFSFGVSMHLTNKMFRLVSCKMNKKSIARSFMFW